MMQRTQSDVERQAEDINARLQAGLDFDEDAYRKAELWQVELGQRTAMLNPNDLRWYWFNRLNSSWEPAGIGLREGILVCFAKLAGVVNVQDHSHPIGDWFLYFAEQEWQGPVLLEQLQRKLDNQEITADTEVFSAQSLEYKALMDAVPALVNNRPSDPCTVPAKQYCAHCGGKLEPQANFCSFCGKNIPAQGGG